MIDLDLLSPQHLADPYETYESLRGQGPIVALDKRRFAVVGHSAAVEILRTDDAFSSVRSTAVISEFFERSSGTDMAGAMGAPKSARYRAIIASDPPDHSVLRRVGRIPFLPRAIARHEPHIRGVVDECVSDFFLAAGRGEGDLVHQIAAPVPVYVIADLLGAPQERRNDFKRWSDNMAAAGGSLEEASAEVGAEMFEFFSGLVEQRRRKPTDDIVSLLVANGEALDAIEIVIFCQILLIAGNETTTNLIGNWCRAVLVDQPHLVEQLADHPERIPVSIEEALRFESPFQGSMRTATRGVDVEDTHVPEGSSVLVLLGAANRDPAVFPQPSVFIPDREPNDHLAFGFGIHFCLGASLARLEARLVSEALIQRAQSVTLRGDAVGTGSALLRGYRSLPVTATAR